MNNLLKALSFSIFAFLGGPADAYYTTGNNWYDACTTNNKVFMDYLMQGVVEGAEALQPSNGMSICVPVGVVARQVTDIVCQYIIANPTSRQEPIGILAAVALYSVYPCSKK
jgi:hypothetical protein